MGEPQIDEGLLAELAHRLDLREPNRRAVESVVLRTSDHYDVDDKPAPYTCIVDSATGVGKTYIMAGLIEYFAGAEIAARNFLLLAPGRTIRDKSVNNFSRGRRKSLTPAMKSTPFVITKDNFRSPATVRAMRDPSVTKLYIFTVQALTSKTGDGRETHEFQETIGGSFYEFLAQLDDLVILADEQHCYRGPAFSKTITALNPRLVVGLTATPSSADEALVAYRYPLAAAIADRIVKTPIIVGRKDDRIDDDTKLLDGVTLLRYKEQALTAYCADQDLDTVNPVMMVIAKDIAEAEEFQRILDSVAFDGGAWVGKTLLVHSGLTGDEKEDTLAALEAVEEPASTVRIIISVGMLKEGWDVKNVYVIASMRASVSEVMTEQTLGRGMRLPFGHYTNREMLDTVEVLAHEKYSELLARRKALNEAFIDYGTYAVTRELPDGTKVVRQVHTETQTPVVAGTPDPAPQPGTGPQTEDAAATDAPAGDPGTDDAATPGSAGVVDIETRTGQARHAAEQAIGPIDYLPIPGREPIVLPYIRSTPTAAEVTLNAIDLDAYNAFDKLGQTFTRDYSDELRRTKIVGRIEGNRVVADTEEAQDHVRAALTLDLPLEETRKSLLARVMAVPGVQPRPYEVGAAERIVDRVIAGMGSDAQVTLSAYYDRCGQRLAQAVQQALREHSQVQVRYEDSVQLFELNGKRPASKRQIPGHPDGGFERGLAFNAWQRNLYTHAWFDTSPEYLAAQAIDGASQTVIVWARLHRNDLPIKWSAEGREYNPDLVVLEDIDGKRVGWLVETKANKDMGSAEVVAKRRAARLWANVVNSAGLDTQWRYLLLSEDDVKDAQGSWEFMKGFGQ